jgi:hypothetical protein
MKTFLTLCLGVHGLLLTKLSDSKCTSAGGTCLDNASSTCTTGNVQSGKCNGAAHRKCCIGGAAAPAAPPAAPGTCPIYESAPTQKIGGNDGVIYDVVKVDATHWGGRSSDLSKAPDVKDNTMEKTTACAYEKMYNAAKAAGHTISISSAFRTLKRQQYFYDCYITKKCNGGNLAARPGTSNHGRGKALDLGSMCGKQYTGTSPAGKCTAAYDWMKAHASEYGFVRTVQKETWHWEYRPGSPAPSYQ